jgi:hypothetical protein
MNSGAGSGVFVSPKKPSLKQRLVFFGLLFYFDRPERKYNYFMNGGQSKGKWK